MTLNVVVISCFNPLTSDISGQREANNEKPQSGYAIYQAYQERILHAFWGLFKIALHQTVT
jgi:hypothetical protein